MTDGRYRAREYRRLSDAKGGTSLNDQGVDNGDAAEEQGWELGEPYIDDGLSASKYARKKRDDFDQLVDDLKTGPTGRTSRFGADILMLWESSRGSRRVGEWVSFIELCEDKGVKIWVTTHERLYDPANGRDRKALIDDANDSEYESYKTHRRVTRTTPKEARKGRPHGEAPYGLKPVYDERTGKLQTWAEDPERAPMIRELFERLEKGDNFAALVRDFREAGWLNRSGRPFTHGHLRRMAIMHSYAGLRHHNGTVHPGIWDGLVTEERFWNVYRRITDPGRVTSRGGARHELTAGLHCARCDALFSVRTVPGRKPNYRCRNGCMKIQKEPVDEYLLGDGEEPGLILAYLARPDIYEILTSLGGDDAAVQALRGELGRLGAELDEMNATVADTAAGALALGRAIDQKEKEISELRRRERELTLPSSVLSIIEPGRDVRETWSQAPIGARRDMVQIVLTPRCLGKVVVHPAPHPGRQTQIIERLERRKDQQDVAVGSAARQTGSRRRT